MFAVKTGYLKYLLKCIRVSNNYFGVFYIFATHIMLRNLRNTNALGKLIFVEILTSMRSPENKYTTKWWKID